MPQSMLTTLGLTDAVEKGAKFLVRDEEGHGRLPYTDDNGAIDHGRMGAAWAALHGGYRGNEYEGPDKEKAIERLKAIYRSEGLETPAEKCGLTMKGGPGSGPRAYAVDPTALPPAKPTPLKQRKAKIKERVDAARMRGTSGPRAYASGSAMVSGPAVMKDAASQARHTESGKWLQGKHGEASCQAHNASFNARMASFDAQGRGMGDRAERHEKARKMHLKAAAAHDRAAKSNGDATNVAMAEFHSQAAGRHREAADTHGALIEMFTAKV